MTEIKTHIYFWVGLFCISILFFWFFNSVILPFLTGFVLAYLFNPLVDKITRRGISRLTATSLVMIGAGILLLLFFWLFTPLLAAQFSTLLRNLPSHIQQFNNLIIEFTGFSWQEHVRLDNDNLNANVGDTVRTALGWGGIVLERLLTTSFTLVYIITFIIVAPIVAFYILVDWHPMVARIDSWLPRHHAPTIRRLIKDIDHIQGAYIRGQVSVCLIQAIYYSIALSLINLNYAFILGLITGIATFIPYIGAGLGFFMALAAAFSQFGINWEIFLFISAIYGVGQFLEGYLWVPKLIGGSVDLHPVWVMFALMAFGSWMGLTGMLIAIPVTAAIGVLTRFGLDSYQNSRYYLGYSR